MPFDPFKQAKLMRAQEQHATLADTRVYDIKDLKRLAGIGTGVYPATTGSESGSNISVTGNEKAQLMKKHNIQPGTDEWFRLWFSLPYMTGEKPVK